jgi:glutamate N-acetyltransferase/amino-acid N-acetyltransferase
MPQVEAGIDDAATKLSADTAALDRAAHAILTTDTRIKVSTRIVMLDRRDVHITAFAKGAAMIGPNMATMLAFVLTDAAVAAGDLARLAPGIADKSFNAISVEGHTSTNDSLIFLANGAGRHLQGAALAQFADAATSVCADLAREIAADAEGASHLIRIEVEGLRSDAEAKRVAKTVADSALVKTAIFGADPNWGRIVSAAGYAGVDFAEEQLSLWVGDHPLYERGSPVAFDAGAVSAYIKSTREIPVRLKFTLGPAAVGRCTFYTCDLTYDYVRLNAEYTT